MPMSSELESRILAELEESGEENVLTLMAAVLQPIIGDAREIEQISAALTSLVRADLARMAIDVDPVAGGMRALSPDESLACIAALAANLRYDTHWTHMFDKAPLAFAVLTDRGLAMATEILDARGVQWWRPRALV